MFFRVPGLRTKKFVRIFLFINNIYILDIDECALGTDNCANDTATCTNVPGGFVCECITGYTGDGITCTGEFVNY